MFVVLTAKVSLLTTKSETGFEGFILAIRHSEMNPDQSSIKVLQENWCNETNTKALNDSHLITTQSNPQSAATWKKDRKSEQAGRLGSSCS